MANETSIEKDILLTNLYPCEGRIMVIKTSQENIHIIKVEQTIFKQNLDKRDIFKPVHMGSSRMP